jgi:NTP pyrophosphatase (non-canonical NTP hydrolase)
MNLNELAKEIHENAVDKGFFDYEKNIGEMLCLIHSEVSEALEADRENKYYSGSVTNQQWFIRGMADKNYGQTFHDDNFFKEQFENRVKNTFEDELADVIIRVLDLCAHKDIDIDSHVKAKMRYNTMREYKHGKKY